MYNQAVTFSITDVVAVLWRRKLRILFASLLGMALATAYVLQLPQTFVAQAQVVVRSPSSVAADSDHTFYSSVVSDAVISTERDVIGAVGLATRVADAVNLPPPPQPAWQNRLQLAWANLVAIMKLPPAWADIGRDEPISEETKVAEVQRALTTWADKGSSVINLQAATTAPALSAAIVNKSLTFYMDDRVLAQRTSAHNVENALRERLQQTNSEIARLQERVASLMQQPGMIENAEVPSAGRELTLAGARLAQARADLAVKRAAADAALHLQDSGRGNPTQLVELLDQGATSTSELRQQFSRSQEELSRLRTEVGTSHPRYLAAQTAMSGLAGRLAGEARRIVAQRQADATAAEQVVASLANEYAELQKRTSQMGPSVLNVDRERESLANLRKIAGTIEDRLIAITALPLDPNAQILTWAKPPSRAAYPRKAVYAAGGFLIGLVLAGATTLIREYKLRLRPTAHYPAEVLAGRLLGSIPELRGRRLTASTASIFQGIALDVDHAAVENGFRVFAITSGLPDEGKTTVAVHLALALSRLGRRVLVLNCDLHHQTDSTDWNTEPTFPGDDKRLPGVVVPRGTDLHVIPNLGSRTADPITYLRSSRFASLINLARKEYDIVICDTPPVLSVPDAVVVARASDAVLLVSAYNNGLSESVASEISRRVASSGRPLCGVIVTKANIEDASFTSYAGYARRRNAGSLMGAIANQSA